MNVVAENFRTLQQVTIPLREQVTVLIGENNAGKSAVLDAVRLLTEPLDGRRSLYWDADDVARGADPARAVLTANYTLTPPTLEWRHFYGQAVLPGTNDVRFSVEYTPPADGALRGRQAWEAGNGATAHADPEPAARGRVRHVYLPPLRDAQNELSSASGTRVRALLRYLLAETGQPEEALVTKVQEAFAAALKQDVFAKADRAIRGPLADMTIGARRQDSALRFADQDLVSIARALRIRMDEHGLDPREIAESGLGYANLLFIATVLVELRASREQDLTLFLVEEPEAHLHPQLQTLLLEYLRDAASTSQQTGSESGFASRIQIVITTHSPLITASTDLADIVVLKRLPAPVPKHSRPSPHGAARPDSSPTPSSVPPPATDQPEADQQPPDASRPARPGLGSGSQVVALGRLGLSGIAMAKLQRYLDATRSAMFFGPRVLLVEGMAEALLLPEFARRVLAPPEPAQLFTPLDADNDRQAEQARAKRAPWARYRGTTLVPIDGVDFEPYVQVLLTEHEHSGVRVADRVAVITDEDPAVRGDRVTALCTLAKRLGAADRFAVFSASPTLEPELIRANPENLALFKDAYRVQKPQSDVRWRKIECAPTPWLKGAAFAKHFGEQELRKGQFAQDLAARLSPEAAFAVPGYLEQAIRWISGDHTAQTTTGSTAEDGPVAAGTQP